MTDLKKVGCIPFMTTRIKNCHNWLPGWEYRFPINITGGLSGAQTDYQLKLDIPALEGNFDDLRFTLADGQTLIDAWLESKVNDTSAVVWAEFPTTPANAVEQTYYMYYGNGGVSNVWDGAATFIEFDDFEGVGVDPTIWDLNIDNTVLSTEQAFKGSKSAKIGANANLLKSLTHSEDIAIKYWIYRPTNIGKFYYGLHGNGEKALYGELDQEQINYHVSSWNYSGADTISGVWKSFEFTNFNWSTHTNDIYYDETKIVDGAGHRTTTGYDDAFRLLSSDSTVYIDCFLIRKFATAPPSYSFGAVEHY